MSDHQAVVVYIWQRIVLWN